MSIYLEFPAIAEYPLYTFPQAHHQQLIMLAQEEMDLTEEKNTLQDYLLLRLL